MKANPDPTKFWFGQTYHYWADALDQTEESEFLQLTCPVLVVTGTEDIECASTDRLIDKARRNSQDVTYLRIEGMGHQVLDPQWNVLDAICTFVQTHMN